MTRALYHIEAEYADILARVHDADGVLDDDLDAALTAASGEFTAKVEACVAYARDERAWADAIDAEARRMRERAVAAYQRADRVEAMALRAMQRTQTPKFRGERFTVSVASNPPSLTYVDGTTVPPEWERVVPETRKPDNARIKDALLAGEQLPFATLTRGVRLAVK